MRSIREAAQISKLPETKQSEPENKIEQNAEEKSADENNLGNTKKYIKKFFNMIRSMLTDSHDDNAISSKRVVAFLAFICCVIGFFVDLFTDYQITQGIYDSMMWIVVGGLGLTAVEKFTPHD